MKTFLILILVSVCIKSYTQICFNPVSPVLSGSNSVYVSCADYNNDSITDIAVTSNSLKVFLGVGDGSFGTATSYTTGTNPYSIANADFTNDSIIDIAVTNAGSNDVSIYTGIGDGNFNPPIDFAVLSSPTFVTSSDFNGDGNADLAVANTGATHISILLGTGTGSFNTPTNFEVGLGSRSITCNDFNEDGKTDLAIAYTLGVCVMLGNGTGSFNTPTYYTVGNTPYSITSGDFNSDGHTDLATANDVSSNISVLLGTGTGVFGTSTQYLAGSSPRSIANADYNIDGYLDLVVTNAGSANISVFEGTGTGSFLTVQTFSVGTNPVSVSTADFDNDSRMDLTIANVGSNNISVLLNKIPPIVFAGEDQTVCSGTVVSLTAVGASTYLWDNGITNGVPFSALDSVTYTVIGTDSMGCKNSDQVSITTSEVFQDEEICLVTVDTITWKNKIIWEKTINVGTAGFRIYKEIATNIYNEIGFVPYSEPSVFIDSLSQPESYANRYKISVEDTCGDESAKSYYHMTMNLTIAAFGSTMGLNWSHYIDEGSSFIPLNYYIYRGSSAEEMLLLATVPGTVTSYNDVNVSNVYYYMIGVERPEGCNTTKTSAFSYSNKKDNSNFIGTIENDSYLSGTIVVSPNPMTSTATLTISNFSLTKTTEPLKIMDITGKLVKSISLTDMDISSTGNNDTQIEINRSGLKPGTYFIEIGANKLFKAKLLIE